MEESKLEVKTFLYIRVRASALLKCLHVRIEVVELAVQTAVKGCQGPK